MKNMFMLATAFVLVLSHVNVAESNAGISVIPAPTQVQLGEGTFTIQPSTRIAVNRSTRALGNQVAEMLRPATGYELRTKWDRLGTADTIQLKLDDRLTELGEEGYRLKTMSDGILITAPQLAGLFYGAQTLRQLLPPEIYSAQEVPDIEWTVPSVEIADTPRFGWRGLMLDPSRHFIPVDAVKKFIDLLAMHKMNSLHLHLTDDQGWRIEIEAFPKLTEVGARRKETLIGHGGRPPFEYDGIPHAGYYTQEDMREIVAYAKERFINVLPEIDMPGHCMAALAAYPELSCHGEQIEVATRWGEMDHAFCAGKEEVFEFLQQVLIEVMDIFPSEFIHIGADEVRKAQWRNCALCQQRIKDEGLKDEYELQSYFVTRMDDFLNSKGRRLIGWDEILEGGLAPNAAVMSWRGERGGIQAAQMGHDAVMAPTTFTYFDYYQGPPAGQPLAIGGNLPVEKVYSFNPIPDVLTEEQSKHILGVQGQLWSEYLNTPSHTEYMAFPRASALAEVAWTPHEKKDYSSFHRRLLRHKLRLAQLDVNHYPIPPLTHEIGTWASGQIGEQWVVREWSLDGKLDTAGDHVVTFMYTSGAHRLDIRKAELLRGDQVLDLDEHEGFTGYEHQDNTYRLNVPAGDLNGLRIRAEVKADGGSDSNGVVRIHRAE